jgi:uncharacterized protein YjbI with pentapeptide repeats
MINKKHLLIICSCLVVSACSTVTCPATANQIKAGGDYSGCDLRNFNLTNMDIPNTCFDNANLDNASFLGVYAPFSSFKNTSLRGVNFTNANLQASNLTFSNLVRSNLSNADFRGADFTNATIYKTTGKGLMLYGAKFNHTRWSNGKLCAYDSIGKCNIVE